MSSKTYQIDNNNSINANRVEYDKNLESKKKDILISQLKAKIFELELQGKDYDTLNERYKLLENEFVILNNSKNNLEYEKRKKDDEFNKIFLELQSENENLQNEFNNKLFNNKNIFSQNNDIGKQIELKDVEISDLMTKLSDLENMLNRNNDDKNNLQKILQGFNDTNGSQNYKISQLVEDNKTLNQICQEQDNNLKVGNQERTNMAMVLESTNNQIQDLNNQIRVQINNINNLQNQINKCENMNMQYQKNIKDYERQANNLRNENDNLKNILFQENPKRNGESQKNNQLKDILLDRETKIDELCRNIEKIKIMQENEKSKNNFLQEENKKLRNHIITLTEQNQSLINEIHKVIEEDEKMEAILNRKKRITSILINNRNSIDQSLNNIEEYINKGKTFLQKNSFIKTYEYN